MLQTLLTRLVFACEVCYTRRVGGACIGKFLDSVEKVLLGTFLL